jgi:aspartyl-tRNA(Asn)/glutamyl-tRNA(Gln) amidotransferase subunit B
LGTKVEIKNMNSFKAVQKALAYEIERQIRVVRSGGTIVQETRLFDADSEKTEAMRSKEAAHDYRYFPDPDLAPLTFETAQIDAWRAQLPEAPRARIERFVQAFELSAYDAGVLTAERDVADYFEAVVCHGAPAKTAANWIANNLMSALHATGTAVANCPVTPEQLAALIAMIESGELSSTNAKNDVFPAMVASGRSPHAIVEEKGLAQVSDPATIEAWVRAALAQHPDVVAALKQGKTKAAGKLVGTVMRLSKGKANPALVTTCIEKFAILNG